MKVEFEKCPLPLFLLKVGLMDLERLVVLEPAPLQPKVELLRAVLRALRGQEPW